MRLHDNILAFGDEALNREHNRAVGESRTQRLQDFLDHFRFAVRGPREDGGPDDRPLDVIRQAVEQRLDAAPGKLGIDLLQELLVLRCTHVLLRRA